VVDANLAERSSPSTLWLLKLRRTRFAPGGLRLAAPRVARQAWWGRRCQIFKL